MQLIEFFVPSSETTNHGTQFCLKFPNFMTILVSATSVRMDSTWDTLIFRLEKRTGQRGQSHLKDTGKQWEMSVHRHCSPGSQWSSVQEFENLMFSLSRWNSLYFCHYSSAFAGIFHTLFVPRQLNINSH